MLLIPAVSRLKIYINPVWFTGLILVVHVSQYLQPNFNPAKLTYVASKGLNNQTVPSFWWTSLFGKNSSVKKLSFMKFAITK